MLKKTLSFILPLLFIIVLLGTGCKGKDEEIKNSNSIVSVMEVVTQKPEKRVIEHFVSTTGTAMADEDVAIKTKVTGSIDKLYVEEGDYVKQGAPLVDVEPEKFELMVEQAEAGLSQAKAGFENAKLEIERKKKLFKKNAISEGMFDSVKVRYESAQAAYNMAKVTLKQAKRALNDSRIKSPINGFVKSRNNNRGEYVDAMTSGPLLTVIKTDPIRIRFSLPEKYFDNIKIGDKFTVVFSAMPTKNFSGTVSIISPYVDPDTRTISLEGKIDNSEQIIKPGAFAEISLRLKESDVSLVISETALFSEGGQKYVYTVQDGIAVKTKVKIGVRNEGHWEVLNGLTEDSVVVAEGVTSLHDGMKVKVANNE